MVWIVETKDGKMHEVKDESIGNFIMSNKVSKCRLKR